MLDPRSQACSEPTPTIWKAKWIWYPGQLAAAMHTKAVQKTMERCKNVGYPGRFQELRSVLYARCSATLKKPRKVRWNGPRARTVLQISARREYSHLAHYVENYTGITQRTATIPAGRITVEAVVDFAQGLPCFILEGGPFSTDEKWEVSLDRKTWVPAESEPAISSPEFAPDSPRMVELLIAPRRIISARAAKRKGETYIFNSGGHILIDFGHTSIGKLRWKWAEKGHAALEVNFGESPEEASDTRRAFREQHPIAPVRKEASPPEVRLPERAFRYVLLKAHRPSKIKALRAETSLWPVEYLGAFESSDDALNRIWNAGAATLHLVMRDYLFLDGIKRDALPWMLDAHACIEASDLVFFDRDVVRQTLLACSLPDHPEPLDAGIANYPLHLLPGFYHDYLVSGDFSFLNRHRERILGVLRFYEKYCDTRGFVSLRGEPIALPDWSAGDLDLSMTLSWVEMLLMRNWEIGAAFLRLWGDRKGALHCKRLGKELRKKIRRTLWDKKANAFIDGLKNGKPVRKFSRFAQVWAILFDLVSSEEARHLAARLLEGDLYPPPCYSINQHWEMLACIKAGKTLGVLERLRKVWGRMLELGPGTFWEDFRPEENRIEALRFYGRPYGKSLCHGFAGAAAVAALSAGVLGIRPTSAGYDSIEVSPRLADLEWARGKIPTPRGPIELNLDKTGRAAITIPAKTRATVLSEDRRKVAFFEGPGKFAFSLSRTGRGLRPPPIG